MNRGRRSMGTKLVDSKPQRASAGIGTQNQTSARKSKLPTKGGSSFRTPSASKNRGRSGSIEPRVSAALGNFAPGSSFKTPRSKSATNRTPSSSRQPLANLHSNGPKRSSVYGTASKQNKENRPLNDKNWQKGVERDLVEFCLNNGYPNAALKEKDFHPINTNLFRTIIEFLYGFLVPGYMLPNPRTKLLHEEMIEILKKINYHGTVSKSHFQTLGGPSWGTIVGVLHFFLLLAKSVVALSMPENFRKMNFPNNDEDGFEIDSNGAKTLNEIEYDHFRSCYVAYNQGSDTFADQENQLYWDLMDSKGINEEAINELDKQLEALKHEHQSLKEDTGDFEALNDESTKVLSDIKGLQDYLEKQQKYLAQKTTDLKGTCENLKLFLKRIEEVEDSIALMETECCDKGINPKDNSNHAEEFVLALQARVEAKKSDVHEADKLKWEQEQIISNKTAKLDEHKRDCNRLIIGLDIEESESKKLMKAEPEYIQSWAHESNISMKEEVSQLSKFCEEIRGNLVRVLDEIEKYKKEDDQLKKDELRVQTEKSNLIPKISQEEDDLKAKLKQTKSKMDSFIKGSSGIAHDMKAKAKDLSEAEKEYFEVQQQLKDVKKDAKETLEYIMRGMERDKKKHIKNRDEAMKKYANYSKRLSKMIKEESVKIQSKLDKMEKEAQNEIDERKK